MKSKSLCSLLVFKIDIICFLCKEMALEDSKSSQQPLHRVASAQFRTPLTHLVSTSKLLSRFKI